MVYDYETIALFNLSKGQKTIFKIRAYLGPRIPRIPRATRVKCFSQVALQLLVHFFACILVRQSAHYKNLRWLTQRFELIQLDPSKFQPL